MYQIKQSPQDFIVKEITDIKIENSGKYLICILKKTNYTTLRAIEHIANKLRIHTKDIGFAGIKDKIAVTQQYISIKNIKKEQIEKINIKDISLEFKGYTDKPISLGDLKENEFTITIRDVNEKEINKIKKKAKTKCIMPNFFGKQRFSQNNIEIGRNLIKSDFKKAIQIILKTNPDNKENILKSIKEKPNDAVRALRLLPKKLLILYTHAYQSHIWNNTLKEYMKNNKKNIKIPLIGFGTEINNKEIEKTITKITKKENITFRSFINRSIPEISLEGDLRDAFTEIKALKIIDQGIDYIKINFRLKKASYATVAIDFLLD